MTVPLAQRYYHVSNRNWPMSKRMSKKDKPKSFMTRARAWATQRGLFGPQAFLRYVMFSYLESLNQISGDFVFKGGNLLWIYIKTPRATIDLDLTTLKTQTHVIVKRFLKEACTVAEDIHFSVEKFEEIKTEKKLGAAVTIAYRTDQGASNRFDIDVVYRLGTDVIQIQSPIAEGVRISAASLENIVTDKLAAVQRFGGGNTRMKDFDDLWRISQSDIKINHATLKILLHKREVLPSVDTEWINDPLRRAWSSHCKRYQDLPKTLEKVFSDVNRWLKKLCPSK
jgi:hypothetical protein